MIIDLAPASAARRRISKLLARVCIARVPGLLHPGETRMCGTPLRDGYYCRACMARLKTQSEKAS